MQLAISRPATIGSLRPGLADPVAFSNLSESQPPTSPAGGGDKRQDGEKADLQPGHMPLGGQPGGEPGEKEHQHGIAGKLADTGADDLPFAPAAGGPAAS